jgi:hypothetical protein
VHDIGLNFEQPQTNARKNIVLFPPAIYMQDAGRAIIERVRISNANGCIDARGNAGGAFINDVECGALTYGMLWDGSADSVHWLDFHFWAFGDEIQGNQPLYQVYSDQSNICFSNGRIDDLFAKGTSCFSGNAVFTANASVGGLPQMFEGIGMDNNSSVRVAGGSIRFMDGYTTGGRTAAAVAISVSGGGNLWLSHYQIGTNSAFPTIQVSGGNLWVDNAKIICANNASSCATVSNGMLQITDSVFHAKAGTWAVPYLAQTGGSMRLIGNYFITPGEGIGVSYASDYDGSLNWFSPESNQMNHWTYSLPSSAKSTTSYFGNPLAGGTAPTASGSCAINTQVGGQMGGSFKAGGACSGGTVILTFAGAAPNGYACDAHDLSTPANSMNVTSYSPRSVTFTGKMAARDLIVFKCIGF